MAADEHRKRIQDSEREMFIVEHIETRLYELQVAARLTREKMDDLTAIPGERGYAWR